MENVEVVQLVPTAGEQIVVCQCHISCVSFGAVPGQGCCLPDASMTGAGVVSAENCGFAVAVLTLGSTTLLRRSSFGFSWGFQ